MIKSGFFEAILQAGVPDRAYNADQYANRWGNFLSKGIAIPGGGELTTENEVSIVAASFNTEIAIGNGWIVNDDGEGYDYYVESTEQVTHSAADPTNPRIDRIVLELNLETGVYQDPTKRQIIAKVVEGTPAASPAAPALTRTSDIYQISLAQILIPANVGSLDTATLTDERSDDTLCGVSNIVLGITPPTGDAEVEKNTITRLVWPDTGAADAYVVDTQGTFDIAQGNQLSFIAGNNNTGASTVAVDGQTALNIKTVDDAGVKQDPEADAIVAGQLVRGYIDSGFFVLAPKGGANPFKEWLNPTIIVNPQLTSQTLTLRASGTGSGWIVFISTSSTSINYAALAIDGAYVLGSATEGVLVSSSGGEKMYYTMCRYESSYQLYSTVSGVKAYAVEGDVYEEGVGKEIVSGTAGSGITVASVVGSGWLHGIFFSNSTSAYTAKIDGGIVTRFRGAGGEVIATRFASTLEITATTADRVGVSYTEV